MSRNDRQCFLGPDSDAVLWESTVGLIGLGGGGSHFVQQCAHIGIGGYVLCDPDIIEDTNTNRLVGGTNADVEQEMPKVSIAERTIRALQPNARIVPVRGSWQDATEHLKLCDVILGAPDSFKERDQLERFARRYLIPYIDVGMDVIHRSDRNDYLISGQVILSVPGQPCLRCCNFITDERLAEEARQYGAAGGRPQVVWPNGVLASTAVGLMIRLLTPWSRFPAEFNYLEYDGNRSTVSPSFWVDMLKNKVCVHHPADETGDPLFDIHTICHQ
jgi:molybdopterin-synthase adenylyltransferase